MLFYRKIFKKKKKKCLKFNKNMFNSNSMFGDITYYLTSWLY